VQIFAQMLQGKVKVIVSFTLPHGKEPNKSSLHICHPLLPFPKKITLTFPRAWLAISLAVRIFLIFHTICDHFSLEGCWEYGPVLRRMHQCHIDNLSLLMKLKSNLDNSSRFFMSVI
jgi:hypothetical protein